jgi:flagellar biosynthesis/type III secretory pathway M-ring protein FliF/YscJ
MIATTSGSSFSPALLILWVVFFWAIWFIFFRPRRNRRKAAQEQAFKVGQTNLTMHDQTPPSPPGYSSEDSQSKIDALAKIAELHAKGILSEEEFVAQKKRILGT